MLDADGSLSLILDLQLQETTNLLLERVVLVVDFLGRLAQGGQGRACGGEGSAIQKGGCSAR